MRFSSDPPYSSVRLLLNSDRNCVIRYPCAPWISTKSHPASFARRAPWPYASMMPLISSTDNSRGISITVGSGIADGATGRMPDVCDDACRPPWKICGPIRAPFSCAVSTRRLSPETTSSLWMPN